MDAQLLILIITGGALLTLLLLFLLVRLSVIASIAGFSWRRTVVLEHYIWVNESSEWGYPEGSRNHHTTWETYYTTEITGYNTTTTTNADGTTTTTSDPIYSSVSHTRTVYKYEIQRWRKSRDVIAEEEDRNPYWPHYILDHTTKERVRDTKEKYLVNFQTTKGKQYQRKLPESEWMALDDQVAYRLHVTLYGRVTRYESDASQAMVMAEQASTQAQQT